MTRLRASADPLIVAAALGGILTHFTLHSRWPLVAVLVIGGVPLVPRLLWKGAQGEFGSDQLAGISILASALLGEYLAGAIVVLMLSGGETLEAFAVAKATSVLTALAARLPTLAHRRTGDGFEDVPGAIWPWATRSPSFPTRSVPWTARWSAVAAAWTTRT